MKAKNRTFKSKYYAMQLEAGRKMDKLWSEEVNIVLHFEIVNCSGKFSVTF